MKIKLLRYIIMVTKFTFYGFLIQMISFSFLLALDASGQEFQSVKEVTLNLNLKNITIEEVFKAIEKETDYYFQYDNRILDQSIRLDFRGNNNTTIADYLIQISEKAKLHFKQLNNSISVSKIPFNNKRNKSDNIEIIIQTRTVSGKVTALEDNSGLPGVNVIEKGTNNGTVTNVQGEYSLQVSDGATLVFSSVGYTPEEVEVGNRSTIDIVMNADIQQLQELVVVGYGSQEKKYITGSIASVDVGEVNKQVDSNIQNLLQGRVAGLDITPSSGAPGASVNVNIRGVSSINAGTGPLYVIDGIQVGGGSRSFVGGADQNVTPDVNPLSLLNPQDIESIQVLKDASSTAIYGARGANGVIIITTKKGKYGQAAQINLNSYTGVQSLHNKFDLMNGREHAQFVNDFLISTGSTPAYSESDLNSIGEGTDWQEEITRSGTDAMIQSHQLSMSGSTNNLNYYVSGSYFDHQGIVINTGLTRYTFRSNVDLELSEKARLSSAITYSRTENAGGVDTSPSDNVRSAIQKSYFISPAISVFDTNGEYIRDWPLSEKNENPVEALKDVDSDLVFENFLGSFGFEYDILENLTFKTTLGLDYSTSSGQSYYPTISSYLGGLTNGRGDLTENKQRNWINEYTLSYGKSFGASTLNIMVGSSIQRSKTFISRVTALGFPNDIFRLNAIQQASGSIRANSDYVETSLAGFLGRLTYDYDNRYLLTASIRRDGASVFGPNRKWGTFGSFSAGWRISEESFLENSKNINDLKLRVGYGVTGNSAIGPYQSFAAVGGGGQYILGGVVYTGTRPIQLANEDIGWEQTVMTNFGLDFSLFSNRFSGSIDYFDKTTNDMLLSVELDFSNGVEGRKIFNTGSVTSRGLELVLAGEPVRAGDFSWNTELNLTTLNNEIKSLGASANRNYGGFSPAIVASGSKLDSVGLPIGSYYGYQVEGTWNTQQEINQAASAGFDTTGIVPGDLRIQDTDGNGFISGDDRVILGNPFPDFYFGFNNTFNYKAFSLTVFIRGVQGSDVINGAMPEIYNTALAAGGNKHVDLVNRWTPSNTSSDIPRINARGYVNDAPLSTYVEDGSFVKLQNVQLTYTLRKLPQWLRSAQVYLSGQNLLTFTNYSGIDPSLIGSGGTNYGIDFGAYPTATTYLLGVNLGF